MSLQFVFGNSGSGKSHHIYTEIVAESMKFPEKKYMVIVPEQFTMQIQEALVNMHPRGGIMNIDVLSFGRLAFRVMEENGKNTRTILDDVGKSLILRKIANDCEKDLRVLGGNIRKTGYISVIKSMISEFTQYNIGQSELEQVMTDVGRETSFSYKVADLKIVYDKFQKYLEGHYITKEEILDVLSSQVTTSNLLSDSVVVFDDFTGFTPVQVKVMREMLAVCEKMYVTITIDERENPYIWTNNYQLFALSKQCVHTLSETAKEKRIEIEEPVNLFAKPVYRFRDNEVLGFLESELFRGSKKQYTKEQNSVSCYVAEMPKGEVGIVARKILHLIRNEGYRYSEIAVVTNSLETYRDSVDEVFSMYRLPFFMDHKRSILLNSFVEYIRSLLGMVEENFTHDSVLRFLRTGLTKFDTHQIDLLDNYTLAFGIRGYKRWQEKWINKTKRIGEERLQELNHMRVKFVEEIEEIVFVCKQKNKTVQDITFVLYEFFVKQAIQEKLLRQETIFREKNELTLAKEYAQIYRIVMELLEKFVALLGEESITIKEYCELLDAGFEEAKVGVIPPAVDQITVGDIQRTRLNHVKALFFIGVNDTLIPGDLTKSGLLSERDREQFEKSKIALSPSSKEKIYQQKFYIYLNITKPTKHLFLSFSKTSTSGNALRPAYIIGELKRLFLALEIQEEGDFLEQELVPESGISYLVDTLRNQEKVSKGAWRELYTWYFTHSKWKETITRLVQASFYKNPKEKLTRQVALELYGANFLESATRMERFGVCAYAHFLNYGLHLKERDEYTFEALDMGNIFHEALERFSKKLEMESLTWVGIPEDIQERFVMASIEESIADYGNAVLYSSARNTYVISRIQRLMRRTIWAVSKQLEQGDFKPSGYEVVFPGGKIDRVDTYEEDNKLYVKVVDYKTGSKEFDVVSLYHGIQMQLVVYMNAAMEMERANHPEKEIVPAGIFYYKIKDPLVKRVEEAKLEFEILKELKLDGLVNQEPEVLRHMDKGGEKTSNILPSLVGHGAKSTDFELLGSYTKKKITDTKERILEGDIQVSPYEYGKNTGCDYCMYKNICRFDKKVDGYAYRRFSKMSQEQIFEQMKQEIQQET
jgi:ATP-dependent nuclease, subunit B